MIFQETLLRSRARLVNRFENVEEVKELYRLQGMARQLRAYTNLPEEIDQFIDQFNKDEIQQKELEEHGIRTDIQPR